MGKMRGVPTPERHSTKTAKVTLITKHGLERRHDKVFKNVYIDGVVIKFCS